MEIDHFFAAVTGPDAVTGKLGEAGFVVSAVREHPGQGTASRGVFFENAYLELIWLADPTEAEAPAIERTRLRERTDPGTGACPFGIGFRGARGEAGVNRFRTWDYRPPYVPDGMAIEVGLNSENVAEPLLFVLPWSTGPAWDAPVHPNGTRRVTRLSLTLEAGPPSTELTAVMQAGLVNIQVGGEYLMDVELDQGGSGTATDFRPVIPLLIHR